MSIGLKVMAKKELVKIETQKGEEPNSTIYVMSMPIKDLGIYMVRKQAKVDKKVRQYLVDTEEGNI